MKARLAHMNRHVLDLDASIAFYREAFGLEEIRRKGPDDGSWQIVFLGNDESDFQLELTWNKGRVEPYDNGGEDTHIAFHVPDIDAAHAIHDRMGCIAYENEAMGIYFVTDPDGCWCEVIQAH